MWRPSGELQESLTVAVATSVLALGIMAFAAPDALHEILPGRGPGFSERAIRSELMSLARAQDRYFATQRRYAYDLSVVPWRSGLNIWVKVREADSLGFRATASVGGSEPAACEIRVRRRAGVATAADAATITCGLERRR